MKLKNDVRIFLDEFELYCKNLSAKWTELLRNRGSIAPKTVGCSVRLSRISTWRRFLACCILSHFLDESTEETKAYKWYVKMLLEEQTGKWGEDNRIVAHTILESKPQMTMFILETSYFHNERELFGLLGKEGKSVVGSIIVFWREPRKPVRQQRIRGYRDHGSLRPAHTRTENYGLTEEARLEQEEIERRRRATEATIDFLRGGIS